MRGPSEGLREDPALGRGGRGKGATPQLMAGPRGQDCHAAPPPPPGRQEASPGDQRAPPTPPPPTQAPERAGGRPHHPPPAPTPVGGPQARPSAPPGPGGHPPPRRDGDAVRATAAGPAPANPHRRAGAAGTTEQEGGRAPHDPPVTTAHSGMTEGGFRSAGAPGGAVHGPPLTPPPLPGRHFSPDRTRTQEGNAPATRRGPGWSTAGCRPEEEQGGRGATPPPPRLPTGPPAAGTPAPTPRGRGDGPPPPERGAGVRPAPAPQPLAPMGAAKNKRAHACAPGRRTDRTQRSRVSTNRSGMGGHAPHGRHNASDTRFVACPGKAEGRNEAERPPALQAPPRPHNRGIQRTPPPPPAPQHKNAMDPPHGAQPPQGQSRAPTPARPRPQHGPRQPAQWTGSRERRSA